MADDFRGVNVVRSESVSTTSEKMHENALLHQGAIDRKRNRYPHCIVWTPIPLITWLFPVIGHMGICTTAGVIRDFAGPYFVSEDNMGFGNPTKYWQLSLDKVPVTNSKDTWDRGGVRSVRGV
ncbi:Transmembrane protein 222 [Lamellibrachia satsuma]|nr:Transmembrane protein 222 [Lamellibrachia satsuma]